MPKKIRELRAELRRAGFVLKRTRGSHQTWEHASGASVLVTGNDGDEVKPYQEKPVRDAIQRAQP